MADKGAELVANAAVFLLLTWIAVGLRVYSRAVLVRSLGIDDKVMVFLLVLFTVYASGQIYGGLHGIGRLDSELRPEEIRTALRLFWILELMNVCSTCLLKISVGYFLLRVAIDRPHIWIIRTLMGVTVLFGTIYVFMVALQCRPVVYIMTIAATVLNTGADFIFATLPWFIVRSMSLPIGTKIVVVLTLGIAAIASMATIVRALYIPTLLEGKNFLYETTNFGLWSTVEPGVGIVAASIATLRPLYQLILSKMGRSTSGMRREAWRQRQQARRNETSRMVRAAHNLDPENPPVDTDITSPQGVLEVNPPSQPVSKFTNSISKSGATDGGASSSTQPTLTLMEFPPALRLSDDFRRTMERPPEEWLAIIRVRWIYPGLGLTGQRTKDSCQTDEANELDSRESGDTRGTESTRETEPPAGLAPAPSRWWPPQISLPWSIRTQKSQPSLRSVESIRSNKTPDNRTARSDE